jgi:hypothetical protein
MTNDDNSVKICDEVQKTIKDLSSSFESDENYKKFLEYYEDLKRLGIAKKQHWDLPQRNTLGRPRPNDLEAAKKRMNESKWRRLPH